MSLLTSPALRAQGLFSTLEVQKSVKLGTLALGTITPTQITADTDDWAPTNFSTAFALRVSTDASHNLTGIAGGSAGRTITLENVGSFSLVLKNAGSGSTAANRFALTRDYTLEAGSGVFLKYDAAASRWTILGAQPASAAATGDVVGPSSAVDSRIAAFDGTTGKLLKDGGKAIADLVAGPSSAVDNRIAVYDSTTGKLIKDGAKTISDISPIGSQTIWLPAVGMSPATTNGATATQTEGTAGRPEVAALEFDPTTQQFAQCAIAMPKSWNNGTVTAQFFWTHPSTTTNFGVTWSIAGAAISDGDAIDATYGTAQTVSDTGGTTGTLYISAATSAVTIGGTPATGDVVYFHIARVPSDGGDTMAVAARLIGVKIIYTTSAPTDQ